MRKSPVHKNLDFFQPSLGMIFYLFITRFTNTMPTVCNLNWFLQIKKTNYANLAFYDFSNKLQIVPTRSSCHASFSIIECSFY